MNFEETTTPNIAAYICRKDCIEGMMDRLIWRRSIYILLVWGYWQCNTGASL